MFAGRGTVARSLSLACLFLVLGNVGVADAQVRRELRVALPGVPTTLEPATALDGATPLIARQVFDTLVSYRELSTDVEPALAERWTVSPDGLVWSFTLRPNVKFHDRTPLGALDIAASFDRHLHPDDLGSASQVWAPLLRGMPGVIKEVRAPDPRTFQIVLTQPYAPLLTVLAHPGFGIARRGTGPDASRLVGTGPYRVVDISPGRVAIEAVSGHWTGVPRTARIVFVDIGSDEQADAELAARTLDVWLAPGPPRRVEGTLSVPGLDVGYLAFQTEKEPFSRKPIRRAVAAALDAAGIGATLERSAIPLQSFLPPGVWGRREGSPILGGSQESVKKLLAEGQWKRTVTPTMLVPTSPGLDLPKLAQALVSMLAAADVSVQLRAEPPDVARAGLQSGDYGLALNEATVLAGDPHFLLYPLSASESATRGPRALNYSYYRNPRLDDVLVRASQLSFRTERGRLYQRAQVMLAGEMPWIPLYARLLWAITRPEVRGLRLHPTGFHRLNAVVIEVSGAQP